MGTFSNLNNNSAICAFSFDEVGGVLCSVFNSYRCYSVLVQSSVYKYYHMFVLVCAVCVCNTPVYTPSAQCSTGVHCTVYTPIVLGGVHYSV